MQETQGAIFGSPVKSQLLAFIAPEKVSLLPLPIATHVVPPHAPSARRNYFPPGNCRQQPARPAHFRQHGRHLRRKQGASVPFVRSPPCILLKRESQGVLDYFGVTADEAPTIYLVVLKDQMLKCLLPSHSTLRPHLSHHNVHFALRYKWTGATGDITSADLDAFLAQHEAGNLKVRPPRPLPSIPSSIVAVKRAHRSTSRASQTLPSTWPRP